MSYKVVFPTRSIEKQFGKVLSKIPHKNVQKEIMNAVEGLSRNPRPQGERKIKPPLPVSVFVAQYRLRIGDYRILYDVDDKTKTVWILALRKRSESTYK